MTTPLDRPDPRDPLARTRQPLPVAVPRSRAAHGLTRAAATGRFQLQVCSECGATTYPPRDVCPGCLSVRLRFQDVDPAGLVVADTTIRIPGENHFRERAPWRIGTVQLDCGPIVVAHLHGDVGCGARVRMALMLDKGGGAAMVAMPAEDTGSMLDDQQMREFTCDPKFRRVLVTDGRSPFGQAMVRAVCDAGAALVFVGVAAPWRPFAGEALMRAMPGVVVVDLDLTDTASVMEAAAQIAARVDIIINTSEHVRPGGVMEVAGIATMQAALDVRAIGLSRLAQAFGPVLCMRGADGVASACALVNVLQAHSLMNWPEFGANSAAEAATLSITQCLRAELRSGGIRVLNVFVGPLDTEWYQAVPAPKVAPAVLARAVVAALCRGLEDCYVGDVAKDLRVRLIDNPKALERELGT